MSLQNILTNWSAYRKGREEGGFHTYEHMWSMVVDLNKCIGCNACSVACYAENNLAVVGKERFAKGQQMHWMRIERYWDEPDLKADASMEFSEMGASFLPMMCQQCNSATCEPVCPVAATYHTPDGLNAQVYNRCIGSRYCSNNCPYRLRYFNFYSHYETSWPEPMNLQLNPDLAVRDKGVMEKCTFCVQRIRSSKDDARRENRKVRDGEVKPACVQGCPTSALVFGDLAEHESAVSKLWQQHHPKAYNNIYYPMIKCKTDPSDPHCQTEGHKEHGHEAKESARGYRIFEALNTDPKVLYLERVREV